MSKIKKNHQKALVFSSREIVIVSIALSPLVRRTQHSLGSEPKQAAISRSTAFHR